jgi:hypothetical protein
LSPQVVNIDRLREEKTISGKLQSTRDWANGVKSTDGKSLQCDAENGGKDRKAYLLVPTPLLPTVQPLLQQYLVSIRNSTQSQSDNGGSHDRPDEIYVPTASVQRNVDFLLNMSSADIWKTAPSTIRTATNNKSSTVSVQRAKITPKDVNASLEQEQMCTPIRHGHSSSSVNLNPMTSTQDQQTSKWYWNTTVSLYFV